MLRPLAFFSSLLFSSALLADYQPTTLTTGASAPGFSLPDTEGEKVTFADIEGEKATAVIFTTNHCPDAIATVGRMLQMVEDYKDRGVGFVAINSNSQDGLHPEELGYTVYNDSPEHMKLLAEEKSFNLPYLYDGETQETAKAYGAVATPHIFIFDSSRRLQYNGRIDNGRRSLDAKVSKNEARDALDALLAAQTPEVAKTRPTGCSLKWKEKSGMVAEQEKKWNALPVVVETASADEIAELVKNRHQSNFRLFNVWSTTCGPCVLEFPDLIDVYRQYSWQEFEFIPISLDPIDSQEKVHEFLDRHESGLSPRAAVMVEKEGRKTNNLIFDGDSEALAAALDPEWNGALPHTALINAEGKVLYRHTGQIDPIELKRAIVAEVWKHAY